MEVDYTHLTEVAGDSVSREQVERMYTRYSFARQYCSGKNVLEVGCGSGQGLGYLERVARKVIGGDYSSPLLLKAQRHYKGRIPLIRLDAQLLPVRSACLDVLILYEAIYYLQSPERFIEECLRVLRRDGVILMCNPNKNLPDFNPSPNSYRYFSASDLVALLRPYGLKAECYGDCMIDYGSLKQRFLSFIKKTMVRLDLMPRTMSGKKLFKRLVFGKLVPMPQELTDLNQDIPHEIPCAIDSSGPDLCHKVIFVVAKKE